MRESQTERQTQTQTERQTDFSLDRMGCGGGGGGGGGDGGGVVAEKVLPMGYERLGLLWKREREKEIMRERERERRESARGRERGGGGLGGSVPAADDGDMRPEQTAPAESSSGASGWAGSGRLWKV